MARTKRGGARPGAGRPSGQVDYELVTTLRLDSDAAAGLSRGLEISGMKQAEFFRWLLGGSKKDKHIEVLYDSLIFRLQRIKNPVE